MKIYLVKWASKGHSDGWFLTPNEGFVSERSSLDQWERVEVHLSKEDAEACFKDPESGKYFVVELEV